MATATLVDRCADVEASRAYLREAMLDIESAVRAVLAEATAAVVSDVSQRHEIAGAVAAILLRHHVQAASNSTEYLEKIMRTVLTP